MMLVYTWGFSSLLFAYESSWFPQYGNIEDE